MTKLTIYGDFNCPFSALASARVDVLLAAGQHEVEWRAVQHDTSLPAAGEAVVGDVAEELASEVASILELSQQDVRLHLAAPRVRSNTAAASAAFAVAGTDAHRVRRRLFAAVWAEGRAAAGGVRRPAQPGRTHPGASGRIRVPRARCARPPCRAFGGR